MATAPPTPFRPSSRISIERLGGSVPSEAPPYIERQFTIKNTNSIWLASASPVICGAFFFSAASSFSNASRVPTASANASSRLQPSDAFISCHNAQPSRASTAVKSGLPSPSNGSRDTRLSPCTVLEFSLPLPSEPCSSWGVVTETSAGRGSVCAPPSLRYSNFPFFNASFTRLRLSR